MITDKLIDNVAQLQIIDDKKKNYRKKSVHKSVTLITGLNDQGLSVGLKKPIIMLAFLNPRSSLTFYTAMY